MTGGIFGGGRNDRGHILEGGGMTGGIFWRGEE